jgi:hypothetical protein
MLYFNSLPQIITPDENGNPLILTNLMTRAKLLEELKSNPMLFYKYNIQESDTPEIIADKYYDDPNRFWIVLYSNEILNPIWDWPLTQEQFLQYIDNKYAEDAANAGKTPFEYTNLTIHAYQKITETTDSVSSETTRNIVSIDEATYNSLIPTETTYAIGSTPNVTYCTVNISKNIVTLYDYEYDLNESKREIKLLNTDYVSQMEQAFIQVMGR